MSQISRIKLAGTYLRSFRERAGLSFNQAAEKLGCSLTLLSFIENGSRSLARKVSIEAVSRLYDLTPAEVGLLQLLYGDKQLRLGADRESWQLFARIAADWEAAPDSFEPAELDQLMGEGMALFQTHAAELHDIYARLNLAKRDYARAREHARQALASHRPDSFVSLEGLHNNQGEIWFHEGQQLEARLQRELLKRHKGQPADAKLCEQLRQQALKLYDQARDCFERALASRPDYERGAFQLGLIYYNLAHLADSDADPSVLYQRALEWLGRVAHARPVPGLAPTAEQDHRRKWACAFSILARLGLGEVALAGHLLDALICANPAFAFGHYLEAIVCCRRQRFDEALAALQRAGALEPAWLAEAGQEIEFYELTVYLERQGCRLEDWLARQAG